MVRILRILSVIVTATLLLSISSAIDLNAESTTPRDPTSVPENKNAPEWEVGDEWVMGFEENIDEGDLLANMPPDERFLFEYINFDFDLSTGVYESLKVMESGVDINDYSCYKTDFEAYYALAAGFDINMNIDENDYQEIMQKALEIEEEEYYDDEEMDYYDEDFEDIFDDIQMTLMGYYKGTVWVEADLTGDVYFTEDKLAVAKEVMEYTCNANIVYDFKMEMHLEESYMSVDMETTGKVNLQMEDVKINFIKEYEPPVDIFEFPISSYDYWYTDTTTTFEISDASGTITYDIQLTTRSEFDIDENIDEEGEIQLSKDMFDDQTYEYEMEFSGDVYDNEYVEKPDGDKEECTVIEFDEYSYDRYDYYDYDEEMNGYSSTDVRKESSEDSLVGDFSDPGSFSDIGYVNTLTGGEFYYSEEEAYVIQEELTGFEGVGMNDGSVSELAIPLGAGSLFLDGRDVADDDVADLTLKPKEYRELAAFKDGGRDEIRSDFDNYKSDYGKSDSGSVLENSLMFSIIAVIVIIVLVVTASKIMIRRKKGKRVAQAPQQPLTYPESQQRQYYAAGNVGQPNQPAVQGMSTYNQGQVQPAYQPAPRPIYAPASPPHYHSPPPPPPPPPQQPLPYYRPPPPPPYY